MNVSSYQRAPLPARKFEVVVVGGGAAGVAIARACALAGKKTLLLEQHDFGSGATSLAPRVVGDVLSDLERGDFSLARETLRQRDRLLFERPHLVRQIPGLIPLASEKRRSRLELRFGLWLRRQIAKGPTWRLDEADTETAKRRLQKDGAVGSVIAFDDAVCEFPERLTAEWLREAIGAGAVVRNYCRAVRVKLEDGSVKGVAVRDVLSGEEQIVAAEWVINAAGSFGDQLCIDSGVRCLPTSVPAWAVHLVLPKFTDAPDAVVYTETRDGAQVVLSPWNEQLLLSTVRAGSHFGHRTFTVEADVRALLATLAGVFPHVKVEPAASFAGPIATVAERSHSSKPVHNRSAVVDHASGGASQLLSVVCGSLTAIASAIAECFRRMNLPALQETSGEFLPATASGISTTLAQWARTVASVVGIPETSALRIAALHGRGALCVARLAASNVALRQPLCPHTDHVVAEAVDAVRYEAAVTLSDILLRRVPVGLSACWSQACTETAATRIGKVLQWSDYERGRQIEHFEMECGAFRAIRKMPWLDRPNILAA